MSKRLHVAVGVVINTLGEVLVAKRLEHSHMGGYWEFPGGKVEEGESPAEALARELKEEINIKVEATEKLIQIPHNYPDKQVLLDVFLVDKFSGEARGAEGQEIAWAKKNALKTFKFPPANKAIIAALRLPKEILISGDFSTSENFLARLARALSDHNIEIVQVRVPALSEDAYIKLCQRIADSLFPKFPGVKFFANCSPETFPKTGFSHLHLSSSQLQKKTAILTLERSGMLSAAIHNETERLLAEGLGVDFLYLSPVKPTASHPEANTLGWNEFKQFVRQAQVPIYALGGVNKMDIDKAVDSGGQGIAGISCYWQQG